MNRTTLLPTILALTLSLFLSARTSADEPKKENTIAVVDVSHITTTIGYERLNVLNANPETRKAINDLLKEKRELQKQLLTADSTSLDKLQQSIGFIERKLNAIRSSIARNEQYASLIQTFVRDHYSGRYLLILGKSEAYQISGSLFMPREDVRVENITLQVLADMQAELY